MKAPKRYSRFYVAWFVELFERKDVNLFFFRELKSKVAAVAHTTFVEDAIHFNVIKNLQPR